MLECVLFCEGFLAFVFCFSRKVIFLEVFFIATKELSINEEIKAKEVRLIDDAGEQLGVIATSTALAKAYEKGLDLVEISPNSAPPVCRIMDYGKYRFEREKKEKEQKKKKQTTIDIKEIQLSCRIDTHDFETKLKHARRFLESGAKVKVGIKFKGREMSHTAIGLEVITKFGEACEDIGVIEKKPVLDGRQMIMFLNSKLNVPQNGSKKSAKAE